MILFKRANSSTMSIVFHHRKKVIKATATTKKATVPQSTTCYLYQGETKDTRKLVATGMSKPVRVVPVIVADRSEMEIAVERYGRRVLETMRADDGQYVVVLRGDNFCYETGRKEALAKALESLPKDERAAAWLAFHWRGFDEETEDDEETIDLTEIVEVGTSPSQRPFTAEDADGIIKQEA